jgi:hypothetical protein
MHGRVDVYAMVHLWCIWYDEMQNWDDFNAVKILVTWERMHYTGKQYQKTCLSDRSPKLWTRGIKIGFKEVTPTIPSRKQICMVGLKIFILSFKGKENRPQGVFDWNIDQKLHRIRKFKVMGQEYAQTHGCWRERNLRFGLGEFTPSYESSYHGYMVNLIICYWNAGRNDQLRIRQPNVKTKFFDTDVQSDLTARSSPEMQISCLWGKNQTESQIGKSWGTFSSF